MIGRYRAFAVGLGAIILCWQAGNAARGKFVHPFLAADLVVAAILLVGGTIRHERASVATMFVAFLATASVFLAATASALLRDGYSLGRVMTALGIVPCLLCVRFLGYRLTKSPG